MSKVEQIGDATLYLGDCLEILPTLGKVDAVVTDPPYGINYDPQSKKYGAFTAHNKIIGDDEPFDPSHLLQCAKVILWGGNCFASRLPDSAVWLAWDKVTRNGLKLRIAEHELAWTRGLRRPQCFRHLWSGAYRASEQRTKFHPTQKPVALIEWCINLLSVDSILDPYMGSGTTGVACANLNRKFIGVEIEPKYFDIACERIDDAYKQGKLLTANG